MQFYKLQKDYRGIKRDSIVVDSHFHWRRNVVTANAKEKTQYLDFRFSYPELSDVVLFKPLNMVELNKLKPHLTKMLIIDYKISFNKNALLITGEHCCKECGEKTFKNKTSQDNFNFYGTCNCCQKRKIELYKAISFKVDIFDLK